MTAEIFNKLLAITFTVILGYIAGRLNWLGPSDNRAGSDPVRVLSNAAFYIFVPALLFRTMARLDLAHMPWHTVTAFFVPLLTVVALVYAVQWRRHAGQGAAAAATRTITACFGNAVQVGIPFALALFGEGGLALHLALVSLHALVLLTVLTVLVELALARENARRRAQHAPVPLWRTLLQTARNTLVHPVVLPVAAGLVWNLSGLGLHPVVDESLATLGSGVVPLCLVLIGVSLAAYGVRGHLGSAAALSAIKLLLLPGTVLVVAHWGFGLSGTSLAVPVMMAAMPTGANALIFAQRYDTQQAAVSATVVLSTMLFGLAAPLWLTLLSLL